MNMEVNAYIQHNGSLGLKLHTKKITKEITHMKLKAKQNHMARTDKNILRIKPLTHRMMGFS